MRGRQKRGRESACVELLPVAYMARSENDKKGSWNWHDKGDLFAVTHETMYGLKESAKQKQACTYV